jgi:hypothetical protein
MVLQNREYGIQDFLKDVNFVCPKNFNIKYILIPDTSDLEQNNIDVLENNGYSVNSMPSEQNKNTNIYYAKKDLKATHSFSRSNLNNVAPLEPMPIERNNDVPSNQTVLDNPLMGSAVKVVENSSRNYKLIMRENLAGFPKNTLIVFGR